MDEKKNILVIGSLNMDLILNVRNIPKPGESIFGKSLKTAPGGKGANQSAALGVLGAACTLLGCVGDDPAGEESIQNLYSKGVNTSYVMKVKDQPTGKATVMVDDAGNYSVVVIQGANECCSVEYLKKNDQLFIESDYVLLQMEIPIQSVEYGIRRAKELGKTVILNPYPTPTKGNISNDLLNGLSFIILDENNLLSIIDKNTLSMKNIKEGARMLLEKGVKNVIITLGDLGVFLANREREMVISSKADITEEEDCFIGAVTIGLSEGMGVQKAINFANIVVQMSTTKPGEQPSVPLRSEIEF